VSGFVFGLDIGVHNF